jgi:plastocyanin
MKTRLLFAALLAATGMSAQETHVINWAMGVSTTETTIMVDSGDTVQWVWQDSAPHTVTSVAGGAETFTSSQLTGEGETYEHVFTVEGTTNYKCNVHATMTGAITTMVVAGVKDVKKTGFELYPNPVTDIVTITAKNNIDKIEIYDNNGRLILKTATSTSSAKVYMANYTPGTYFVKVTSGAEQQNITVLKK